MMVAVRAASSSAGPVAAFAQSITTGSPSASMRMLNGCRSRCSKVGDPAGIAVPHVTGSRPGGAETRASAPCTSPHCSPRRSALGRCALIEITGRATADGDTEHSRVLPDIDAVDDLWHADGAAGGLGCSQFTLDPVSRTDTQHMFADCPNSTSGSTEGSSRCTKSECTQHRLKELRHHKLSLNHTQVCGEVAARHPLYGLSACSALARPRRGQSRRGIPAPN